MIIGPIPNRWLVQKCIQFKIHAISPSDARLHSGSKYRKSRVNYLWQAGIAVLIGYLDMLLYAVVGNPDLALELGVLTASNWLVQTGDVSANLLIVALCLIGQTLRFAIQQRIIKGAVIQFGPTAYALSLCFLGGFVALYVRYQNVTAPDYTDIYIGSPFQAASIWIFTNVLFFFGFDSSRRIKIER